MRPLSDLASDTTPSHTVLFLGAGSSIPSGAPSAYDLARRLASEFAIAGDDDLSEIASIVEYKHERRALISALRKELSHLQPTGGLLAVPRFSWRAIYTTNYDELVERAYRHANVDCTLVKSNHDYGRIAQGTATPIIKLHGCISRDVVDGHTARIIITDRDYDLAEEYRQTLRARLQHDMLAHDVLIIGHSLSDSYLRKQVQEAARLHASQSTPGRLRLLLYKRDHDRAGVVEQRGIKVYSGSLDDFVASLTSVRKPSTPEPDRNASSYIGLSSLASTTDVSHAVTGRSNATRLFNGRPASYADIAAGNTFERSVERSLYEGALPSKNYIVVTGVAGTGKTSLARRLLWRANRDGYHCWEHRGEFPLRVADWKGTEGALSDAGERGILLVDDCQAYLGQVNRLARELGGLDRKPALQLVLTATFNDWRPRAKSPQLLATGHVEILSQLSDDDIEALLNLTEQRRQIGDLVETSFAGLGREEKRVNLRRRCKADMYVCLKNIFASEELDEILLREYANLEGSLQEVYRYVAAIEAAGAQVHRQLLLRITGFESSTVAPTLQALDGIIEEYDITPQDGIFGWSTRHTLIAQVIARYKFANNQARTDLLWDLVRTLNPTIYVEHRALRDICDGEIGVRSLADNGAQVKLLEAIIARDPNSRVPRHRLISKLLNMERLADAALQIRLAEESGGLDSPLAGYKTKLLLRRARATHGILMEDRRALLLKALDQARDNISRYPENPHSYLDLADVAVALTDAGDGEGPLLEALELLEQAESRLLDEMLSEKRREVQMVARRK